MELKAYIAPLRKWWWLLIASTLVAAISCFIAVSQQPPIYQAKATLLIGNAINNPNPTGNDFFQPATGPNVHRNRPTRSRSKCRDGQARINLVAGIHRPRRP